VTVLVSDSKSLADEVSSPVAPPPPPPSVAETRPPSPPHDSPALELHDLEVVLSEVERISGAICAANYVDGEEEGGKDVMCVFGEVGVVRDVCV